MLKGALDDFALTDIFRLISLAKKTGRLEVLRQAGRGAVYFGEGDVLYAESSLVREPLGQKLIRSGALTEGQLRRALDEHAATGLRLGRVLLSAGWVSQNDLEDAVRGQTEDAVFDLLRWEVGEFTWTSGERVDAEVPVAVSVENLIMEASRRLDELDIIMRKIPSVDAVMAMAAKPPEGAVEINITPDEWRLLVLVNGSRSVANIAETVGVDDFDALKTLYGMLSAGLVEVVTPPLGGTAGSGDVLGEARLEAPPAPAAEPEREGETRPALEPELVATEPPEPRRAVAIDRMTEPEVAVESELAPAEDPFVPEAVEDTSEAGEVDLEGPSAAASEDLPHEREESGMEPPHGIESGAEAEPELEVTFVEEDAAAEPKQRAVPEAWTEEPEPAVPNAWIDEGGAPQVEQPEGWAEEPEPPPPAPAGIEGEPEPPGDLEGALVEPAAAAEPGPEAAELSPEALDEGPPPQPANEVEPVLSPADEAEPDLRPVEHDVEPADVGPEAGADEEMVVTEPDVSEPQEAPRLERSAAVRELAGLWGDSDQPARRPAAQRPAEAGPGDPDARKRVEDDEDINRGLISKLIDGVKGL